MVIYPVDSNPGDKLGQYSKVGSQWQVKDRKDWLSFK